MSNQELKVSVQKDFPNFHLDVSFTMEKGCLGILGASGCGKSMTLKSIAGLFTPDSGHIELNGDVLFDSSLKLDKKPQQRRAGYLFQNYALFPNMTVLQNIQIGMGRMSATEKQNRSLQLLEQFQLQGLECQYPSQLSGGQQQRVALARIFANQPSVLLLDEPFSAMDSFLKEGLRLQLLNVIKHYDGMTVLVTHDRDEAYQLCDQLVLMDRGKIIQQGKTQQVFERPQNVVAARLTGCKNISEIEKIDEHHVRCKQWNDIVLETKEKVTDDIVAIGIRAHEFQMKVEDGTNCVTMEGASITEMPFEWYVTLQNGMWWKTEKRIEEHDDSSILSNYLYIDPSRILLLKK